MPSQAATNCRWLDTAPWRPSLPNEIAVILERMVRLRTPHFIRMPQAEIHIRLHHELDWLAIYRIHDLSQPDELRGSCNLRAFVPIEVDLGVEDLQRSHKIVAGLALGTVIEVL
jgi:hypothetical protein